LTLTISEEQKPLLDSTFGPTGLFVVLGLLQELTQKSCLPLLKDFQVEWKLQYFVSQVRSMEKLSPRSLRRAAEAKANETGDLTALLDQLCCISQTFEAHRRFITNLARKSFSGIQKEIDENKSDEGQDKISSEDLDNLIAYGELDASCHDMLGNYILLL